jgi:putative endonuclease
MREHDYAVYIMSSRTGVLYIGITNDRQSRVSDHKTGAIAGFTKKYKCHRLVYYEKFQYVRTAIAREKQLKGWTRAKKIALIESVNPRWKDLAEHWGQEALLPRQSMKDADMARASRVNAQTTVRG